MGDPLRVILHHRDTAALEAQLAESFPQVQVAGCNSYGALPQLLETFRPDAIYTVRFDGTPGYPRDALFASPGLRWIANGGAGTDHLGQWDAKGVTVTNAAGVAADMMAEYVMGAFLHFSLDIPGMQADQTARVWRARMVTPLKGKTLVIVGLGHTGAAIAERAKAFGMRVLGTRRRPVEMAHVDEVQRAAHLTALLPRADFVAVATPLTNETKGLIGVHELAALKPGAVFADVSRGGVTDQTALFQALRSGQIKGAALDVFEEEPLSRQSPLWGQDNVLVSPHCSSVHDGWEAASFDLFLHNLVRFQDGKPLINIVDPVRGY